MPTPTAPFLPSRTPLGGLLIGLGLLGCSPAAPPGDRDEATGHWGWSSSPQSEDDSAPAPPSDTASTETDIEDIPSIEIGFEPPRGFYAAPVSLRLSSPMNAAELYYTTDGRDPLGETAQRYTEPLVIDTTTTVRAIQLIGGKPIDAQVSHTYLFTSALPEQQAPADYPTAWWTWDRAGGYTADYQLDSEITESDAYTSHFPAAFEALPWVSVALDPSGLFGESGVYERSLDEGLDTERASALEIFSADGSLACESGAGLRMYGGASRYPANAPKKSLRLIFRQSYGAGTLRCALFEDSAVERFDTLVLRARYNHSWIHWDTEQRSRSQYLRDHFVSELQLAMGQLGVHSQPVHLMLNGLYWGLYYLQERPNAAFMADHLGGTEDDFDVLNSGEVIDGDDQAWQSLFAASEADLSAEAAYAELQQWLDVEAFADYMLLNLVVGNDDWPSHNWYAGRQRAEDAGFLFFSWDAEHVLKTLEVNRIGVSDAGTPGELFQALRESAEFRLTFADRVQQHMFDGGVLSSSALVERWTTRSEAIADAVIAESARWGDYRRDVHSYSNGPYELYTLEAWLNEQDRLLDEILPYRTDVVLEQLRSAALYPSIETPSCSPGKGKLGPDQEISLSAPEGEIWFTLDGTDPRSTGGGVSPAAERYQQPLSLTTSAELRARALEGEQWSALRVVRYTLP